MYFSEKTTAKAAARLFSQFAREHPCLDKRQRHAFNNQRLPVFVGNERHFSHNGPETLGNRGRHLQA